MYWFRNLSIFGFMPWFFVTVIWFFGGWLIATQAFNTNKRERLIIGFGLGLIIYLWLSNLIGRWFSPTLTFFLPAPIILAMGIFYSQHSKTKPIDFSDFYIWPILLIWAGVFIYSLLLERGLMIYDDQYHLSTISVIGTSGIPPKYFLNANFIYVYHYGFDLLGASLMRIGNMFAWSAFDFSKAIAWSFSLVLLGFLLYHFLHHAWKSILGIFIFTFLSGTRYLLMLLPSNILQLFDPYIGFLGVSGLMNASFSKSLFMPWTVIPGPPTPYTFGFISGIESSYHMIHTGEWPLALIIIGLLWLLSTRINSWKSIPILVILWSHLALTYESSYGLLLLAMISIYLFQRIIKKGELPKSFMVLLTALLLSIPIALFQGGALISVVQNTLLKFTGNQPLISIHTPTSTIFSINWPPSIFTWTFGDLSLFNPAQLIVGLLEIGPILFFVPMIVKWSYKKFFSEEWMTGLIVLSTLIGFFISIFVKYNPSRDAITRFAEHAITFWFIFLIILILEPNSPMKKFVKIISIACIIIMSVGGAACFLTQLSAIPKPVLSDHITGLDAKVSSKVWGSLSKEDTIFDPNSLPGRATEITGLPTVIWLYRTVLPFWQELYARPTLQGLINNNYRYVYVDERWWAGLNEIQRESLSNKCIDTIYEASVGNEFRKLLDLHRCTNIIE